VYTCKQREGQTLPFLIGGMMMFEYYMTNRRNRYSTKEVRKYLVDSKLNFHAAVHMDKWLVNEPNYGEVCRKELVHKLSEHMLTEKKIDFKAYDNPVYNGHTIEAKTFIMTEKDIYSLLGHFGIEIEETKGPF
jgi:hypothetical protein